MGWKRKKALPHIAWMIERVKIKLEPLVKVLDEFYS